MKGWELKTRKPSVTAELTLVPGEHSPIEEKQILKLMLSLREVFLAVLLMFL